MLALLFFLFFVITTTIDLEDPAPFCLEYFNGFLFYLHYYSDHNCQNKGDSMEMNRMGNTRDLHEN